MKYTFEVEGYVITAEINLLKIETSGGGPLAKRRGPKLTNAVCFLERQLARGPQLVKDLIRRASVNNISRMTLFRARAEIGNIETDPTRTAWRLKGLSDAEQIQTEGGPGRTEDSGTPQAGGN